MDVNHLRLALQVAELQSFRKAAEMSDMLPSKLSRIVISLEDEYGHQIFKRTTRQMQVTPLGEVFLRYAGAIVSQFDRMTEDARAFSEGRTGSVILGYSLYLAADILPAVLLAMKTRSKIDVIPRLSWSKDNQIKILNGELDAGIISGPLELHKGLASALLLEKPIRLMVSKSHPLAAQGSVSFEDLREESFLIGVEERYKAVSDVLFRYFGAHSANAKISQTLDDPIAHEALVQAGIGVALSIESDKVMHERGIVLLDIVDLSATMPISLVWRKSNQSPSLRPFIEIVQGEFPMK